MSSLDQFGVGVLGGSGSQVDMSFSLHVGGFSPSAQLGCCRFLEVSSNSRLKQQGDLKKFSLCIQVFEVPGLPLNPCNIRPQKIRVPSRMNVAWAKHEFSSQFVRRPCFCSQEGGLATINGGRSGFVSVDAGSPHPLSQFFRIAP